MSLSLLLFRVLGENRSHPSGIFRTRSEPGVRPENNVLVLMGWPGWMRWSPAQMRPQAKSMHDRDQRALTPSWFEAAGLDDVVFSCGLLLNVLAMVDKSFDPVHSPLHGSFPGPYLIP